jgi:hypothetical protein
MKKATLKILSAVLITILLCNYSFASMSISKSYKDESTVSNSSLEKKDDKKQKDNQKENKENKQKEEEYSRAKDREKTELIIKYKEDVKEEKKEILKSKVKDRLKLKNMKSKKKTGNYEVLEIDDSENVNDLMFELTHYGEIEYVQPNYKLDLTGMPDDESFLSC